MYKKREIIKFKKELKTIAIDFDGTIVSFRDGYRGIGSFGELLPGAVGSIKKLYNSGCRIIIFTAREEIDIVKLFLDKNKIPYHRIEYKIRADIYIDDRSIHFSGNWNKICKQIDTFRSWEEWKIYE